MRFLKTTALAGSMALASGGGYAATVTASSDATALANALLGSGITITSATLTGADGAAGFFTDFAGTGIGIDAGVILSSGDVTYAPGPNSLDDLTIRFETAGDSDLDALIPGLQTYDAVRLDIEFTSSQSTLFFSYAFASEEYNEYTNDEFNDVFGLFLNGSNIALIPGTTTPVAINTVNGGNPLGTDASNADLYNNNDLDDGGPYFAIEYDGFTDVFTAQGAIQSGANTISFAIADAGDDSLDSAIFIQGGSLGTVDPDKPGPDVVPLPAGLWLMLSGLGLLGLSRRRSAI